MAGQAEGHPSSRGRDAPISGVMLCLRVSLRDHVGHRLSVGSIVVGRHVSTSGLYGALYVVVLLSDALPIDSLRVEVK